MKGDDISMLNEEKVRLMTKLAIYEKKEGKADFKVSKYYRTDYIGLNVINSTIVATFIYLAAVGCIVIDNIETLLTDITSMDLLSIGRTMLVWYLVFVIAYVVISMIVYNIKYFTTKKKLEKYDEDLRKLYKLYKTERKKEANARKNISEQNGDMEIL